MMLGLLLARAGVSVAVLEKHADFLRDFRGDTIHPSTLEVMFELGILDEFLKRPHQEIRELAGRIAGERVTIADFRHLPTHCRFLALMPQWDVLDFLADHARRLPTFALRMETAVTGLIEEGGRVAGVRVTSPGGPQEIRADLVVGADGRHSAVRERAGLEVDSFGAPIDVLWMRMSKRPDDPDQALGTVQDGHVLVMLDRGDYWQCAYVIAKGGYDALKRRGIEAFRATLVSIVPELRDRVGDLRGWDDVKLLTVVVDRLRAWHVPGLLCIGDAAHAMSPIGGVGINLAIQDAVAAANILADPLARGTCSDADLAAVQRRRAFATRVTQAFQIIIQKQLVQRVLASSNREKLPWIQRLINGSRPVRWIR